jgi:hypothetical protein
MRLVLQVFCISAALFLVIITFTPLVSPHGVYRPKFLGLPYTLWVGILITIGLVALTFLSTRIHQLKEKGNNE